MGDYILCFRPLCVQLLSIPPFPEDSERPTSEHDPTSHPFRFTHAWVAFTGASLSEPLPNLEYLDNSRIIYILAYQMTVGFFYLRVTIYNPDCAASAPRARMDVELIGVYQLGEPRVGIRGMSGVARVASGSWLGPEGKRGIWVECSETQRKKFIVAVSFDQSCPGAVPVKSNDDLQELSKTAPRIESTGEVFVDGSWDDEGESTLPNDYTSAEKTKTYPQFKV